MCCMKRSCMKWLLLSVLLFPAVLPKAQTVSATQYQLKAVFLFNFTQFVEWPGNIFDQPGEPFVIGLYGPNVFGNYLDQAVRNETVNGHPIKIIPVSSAEEAKRVHLLFITSGRSPELAALESQLKGQSVLTVSDVDGFCRSGGMIGFINEKNKIKIQINTGATAAANLKVSSKLLRLAELVPPIN